MYRKTTLSICIFLICIDFAYSDIRCCKEPERHRYGDIVRSKAVMAEFMRLYPLPEGIIINEQ